MSTEKLRTVLGLLLITGFATAAIVFASAYGRIGTITHACDPQVPPPTSGVACDANTKVQTWSFDIGWFDPATNKYYLADRSNHAIDIVDTTTDTIVGEILGFCGTDLCASNGPNGVVVTENPHELWAGDGDSTVKVFSLDSSGMPTSGTPLATISTGGTGRADELAFDTRDHLILIANDEDAPPFLTLISADSLAVFAPPIVFSDATDGIEQPVYDPQTHKFFVAVPATTRNPGGEIAVIEPLAAKVTKTHGLTDCTPHGLTMGPNRLMLIGCNGGDTAPGTQLRSIVMDSRNGHIVKTITQVGGSDEVWYNPGDNHYYLAASSYTVDGLKGSAGNPVLGVIDAETNTHIQNVKTGAGSHSVAAESVNNHIYVPLRVTKSETGGIGVYGN
jgi:DNA-binding beta-propeller fold protein YncE